MDIELDKRPTHGSNRIFCEFYERALSQVEITFDPSRETVPQFYQRIEEHHQRVRIQTLEELAIFLLHNKLA